jgi:GAF domain-containing protein
MLSTERDATRLWEELTVRYAEIDLLYAISEILGQTVRLEEAARTILRQVARVVGARRASIMVHDEEANLLRVVASQGFDKAQAPALSPDDPVSIAGARVPRSAGGGRRSGAAAGEKDGAPPRLPRQRLPECADQLCGARRAGALHRRHQPHRLARFGSLHASRSASW